MGLLRLLLVPLMLLGLLYWFVVVVVVVVVVVAVVVDDAGYAEGDGEVEGAALPLHRVHSDGPSVESDDLIAQGQAQPRPLPLLELVRAGLEEAGEELALVLQGYAGPFVRDGHRDAQRPAAAGYRLRDHLHSDGASDWGELYGVAEQVADDVLHAVHVTHQEGRHVSGDVLNNTQVLDDSRSGERRKDLVDGVAYAERDKHQLHLSFLDPLHVQHVVQRLPHEFGGPFHHVHHLFVSGVQLISSPQQLYAHGQRVQRSAHLVEEVLQKVSAALIRIPLLFQFIHIRLSIHFEFQLSQCIQECMYMNVRQTCSEDSFHYQCQQQEYTHAMARFDNLSGC